MVPNSATLTRMTLQSQCFGNMWFMPFQKLKCFSNLGPDDGDHPDCERVCRFWCQLERTALAIATEQEFVRGVVAVVFLSVVGGTRGKLSLAHLVTFPCGMHAAMSMEHTAVQMPTRAVRCVHCG